MKKIQTINVNTCKKLLFFNELVSSTVLHEESVWCPRHIDELEKGENQFFRKLLFLPMNTTC